MVVLDQDPVMEAEAVVLSAAGPDRVLLELPKARRRLARVEDGRAGAGDGVHVGSREGRDTGEPAENVEGDSLGGEDRAGRPLHPGDRAGLAALSVLRARLETGAQLREDGCRRVEPADD